jgi:hypothetical protein
MIKYFRYSGLAVVFAWFFGGGVIHFTNTDFLSLLFRPGGDGHSLPFMSVVSLRFYWRF